MPEPTPITKDDVDSQIKVKLDEIFASSNYRGRVEQTVRSEYKYRRRAKLAEAELETLKAKLPKEGEQVVLTKADADELAAFRALGKVAELTTIKTEHTALSAKKAVEEETNSFAKAGEALDYKNLPAFTRFMVREQLALEFQDVRREDPDDPAKKVTLRMPFVRPKADEKAKWEPLDEYVEREVPEFIESFSIEPQADDEAEDKSRESSSGVTIAATPGVRKGAATSAVRDKKMLEQMEQSARLSGSYSV